MTITFSDNFERTGPDLLHQDLADAGLGNVIDGVRDLGGTLGYEVDYRPEASPAQIAQGDALAAAFVHTPPDLDAELAELRQWFKDNPAFLQFIRLDGATLDSRIDTRTAGEETALLKILSRVVRYLIAKERAD